MSGKKRSFICDKKKSICVFFVMIFLWSMPVYAQRIDTSEDIQRINRLNHFLDNLKTTKDHPFSEKIKASSSEKTEGGIHSSRAEREALLLTIKQLNKREQQRQEEIRDLQKELKTVRESFREEQKTAMDRQDNFQKSSQDAEQLKDRLKKIEAKNDSLKKELQGAQERATEQEKESARLYKQIAALEKSRETNKASDWEEEKSFLEKRQEMLEQELIKEGNESLQKNQDIARLEAEKKDLHYSLALTQQKAKALGNQLRKMRERDQKLEEKVKKHLSYQNSLRDSFADPQKVEEAKEESPQIKKLVKKEGDLEKLLSKEEKQRLDKHYNLGVFYGRSGMYVKEAQEYLKCLQINPYDAQVHYNLAIVYDDFLNDNQKAIEHYNQYLEYASTQKYFERVKKWILEAEQEMRIGLGVK